MIEHVDTLSDWRFWTGIAIAAVLLGVAIAYLFGGGDEKGGR